MGELRDLLEREARRVAAKSDAIDGVVRRAERRHRTRRVVAGATAFAVVIAVGLGAWTLLGDPTETTPADPTPVEDRWPAGAWPHETRAQAEEAQRQADAGNPDFTWHTIATGVAGGYLHEFHGWTEVFWDDSLDLSEGNEASATLYASSCDTRAVDGCEANSVGGSHDEEVLITIERLIRRDPPNTGVWTVTDVGGPNDLRNYANFMYGRLPIGYNDTVCPDAPFAPPNDATVETAARDVLTAANSPAGTPETVWKWLDDVAHPRQGDPDLFAYHFHNVQVTSEYASWEITYVGADFPDDLVLAERCGRDVRDALTAVEVTFPNVAEGGDSMALFLWVTHPEGPRLWYVQ